MDPAENLTIDSDNVRTVLVADDDSVNRMILEGMLVDSGYKVILAKNGQEAIQQYYDHSPHAVLMDIIMPVMDGFEATLTIKKLAADSHVPVIFLTAVTDEDELARCVTVGGDDFLIKPYSRTILLAKLEAQIRASTLYSTIKEQRDEIDLHNEFMLREQKVAKKIFSKVVHQGCLDLSIFKYELSPLSVFNGDLLLAARTPSGGINVLLGDATGHGLPAAIGAVPVSDIFYDMTATGASIADIVQEVNLKLKNILPPEFFFCASVLNISNDFRLLSIWHGGLPDVLIYSQDEKRVTRTIKSGNFPLGVVSNKRLKTDLEVVELKKGDRILVYSDGIIEARNLSYEMFGTERLLSCLEQMESPERVFETIIGRVRDFRGSQTQSDDLTLVEINADPDLVPPVQEIETKLPALSNPDQWNIALKLEPRDMRATNPVSLLTRFANQVEGLIRHKENLYIILSELYNNALDHGVLGLNSDIKTEQDGFSKYLALRQERLNKLETGTIFLKVEHRLDGSDGELIVYVKDSGQGFDYQAGKTPGDNHYAGRGLALVDSLCTSLSFFGNGNEVTAVYRWKRHGIETE